ncbi:MAG TPA: DUF975 family protein [Candidatus Blautia avicola]|uniref:DUF975 family protein n=1 Tax=Candidatus Blautia avicola TaxID=2838483 RepID=A0A9D2QY40_9FIRM|nr:DUF975 family protein [Candidatus Blautia avicola]
MRRSSSDLKALSRQAMRGQWGLPVSAYLLIFICSIILTLVITALLNPYSVLSIITCQIMIYIVSLFVSLLQAGYMKLLLNMNRKEPFSLKDLISPFTIQPDRFLTVNLILLLVEVLLALPLNVLSYRTEGMTSLAFSLGGTMVQSLVGLILSLFFGLSNYLLLDNPQMGPIESLKISNHLMKGNKGRYFYISLSFIPLSIACVFTCYIGFLWLEPYIANTMAHFYMDVTGELDDPGPKEEPPVQGQPFNRYM